MTLCHRSLSRFAAKPCRSAARGLLSSQIQLLLAHKRDRFDFNGTLLMIPFRHAQNLASGSRRDGVSCAQPRRRPSQDLLQGLTITHMRRWQEHYHESGWGHLYQGRFKSFPVQEDGHFLTVARYVDAQCIASQSRRESRAMAMVQPVAKAKRHAGRAADSLGMAGGPAFGLGARVKPAANAGGDGCAAHRHFPRPAVRIGRMAATHRPPTRPGKQLPAAREAEEDRREGKGEMNAGNRTCPVCVQGEAVSEMREDLSRPSDRVWQQTGSSCDDKESSW